MSSTPATVALTTAGIAFVAHPYVHDPAATDYGDEAAAALSVEPARVFKTLMVAVDDRLTVAIVSVDHRLDLKAVAMAHGGKRAELASPALAERRTGYLVGGISPIGQRFDHPAVLDEDALFFDTVFVSGGRRGFDLELAPADLVAITGAVTAAIARR